MRSRRYISAVNRRGAAPIGSSDCLLPEYRGKIPEDSLGVSLNF